MGTIIMYLIIAAAAGAALFAVNNAVKHHYVDPVIAEYDAKLKAEKDRASDAEAANLRLRGSVEKVKAEAATCTAATEGFKKAADDATARASTASAKAEQNARTAQAALSALKSRASGPPTTGDACAQADAILTDLSRDVRAILGLVDVKGPTRVEATQ